MTVFRGRLTAGRRAANNYLDKKSHIVVFLRKFTFRNTGLHRSFISYLLFFLFFLAIAQAEACERPATVPDAAPAHACCAAADEEGDMPAGKVPTWSGILHCHGNLCCDNSGGSQAVPVIRTVVSDPHLVQSLRAAQYSVPSFPPVVASVSDKHPLIPLPPLYLRNCAFLI